MALTTPTYPGINLDANDGPATNAVAIASIFLSRVTLILRFTSRLRTQVTFGLDDCMWLWERVPPPLPPSPTTADKQH